MAAAPGGGLTWARTCLDTRHGQMSVEWRLDHDLLEVDVAVPDGVTADVHLPDGRTGRVTGGRHRLTGTTPATGVRA